MKSCTVFVSGRDVVRSGEHQRTNLWFEASKPTRYSWRCEAVKRAIKVKQTSSGVNVAAVILAPGMIWNSGVCV